jgi:hypothetical protein
VKPLLRRIILPALAFTGLLASAASAAQDYADYKIVIERNIFARNRGQGPALDATARPAPPPRSAESYMVLCGIVRRGMEFVAFVEDVRTGETQAARVGDSLASGRLRSAAVGEIELEFPDGARTVRIGESLESRAEAAPLPEELPEDFLPPGAASVGTGTTGAASEEEAAILERLRQRRQQEGGR